MQYKTFEGRYIGVGVGVKDYTLGLDHAGITGHVSRIGCFGYIVHGNGTRSLVAHFPHHYGNGTYVGLIDTVPIYADGEEKPYGQAWHWNGDFEKPTLTPSLDNSDSAGRGWHGALKNGRWIGFPA